MSIKRKTLGAIIAGGATLPITASVADKTKPPYLRNQPEAFVRRGEVVKNPFKQKERSRKRVIQASGALLAGAIGAKKIPQALSNLSTSLGKKEFKKTRDSLDTAIAIAKRYKDEVGDRAVQDPLFFKRNEKRFLQAQEDIAKLTALKKNISQGSFIKSRQDQLLGLRGTGISKQVDKIIGTPRYFGSSKSKVDIDPDHLYKMYSAKLNKMR
tara:strand:- start:258 stop:893 length:636 start_codon:yes stop_codon:yes gene_type:complete